MVRQVSEERARPDSLGVEIGSFPIHLLLPHNIVFEPGESCWDDVLGRAQIPMQLLIRLMPDEKYAMYGIFGISDDGRMLPEVISGT
jgi:hypothetical protein